MEESQVVRAVGELAVAYFARNGSAMYAMMTDIRQERRAVLYAISPASDAPQVGIVGAASATQVQEEETELQLQAIVMSAMIPVNSVLEAL